MSDIKSVEHLIKVILELVLSLVDSFDFKEVVWVFNLGRIIGCLDLLFLT